MGGVKATTWKHGGGKMVEEKNRKVTLFKRRLLGRLKKDRKKETPQLWETIPRNRGKNHREREISCIKRAAYGLGGRGGREKSLIQEATKIQQQQKTSLESIKGGREERRGGGKSSPRILRRKQSHLGG